MECSGEKRTKYDHHNRHGEFGIDLSWDVNDQNGSKSENKWKKVKTVQRNPVIFAGGCVNVHLLADGTKRLEFNRPRFYSDFTFRDFCVAAAQELLTIARLLGEDNSEE